MARTALTDSDRAFGALLGAALRERRAEARLSRETVARQAGISVETIRKAERGQSPGISFLVLHRISKVLDTSLDKLAHSLTAAAEETDEQ